MKLKKSIPLILVSVLWVFLSLYLVFIPAEQVSESERRNLEQFPSVKISSVIDGSFMKKFEDFTRDQFPIRDVFRSMKARFHYFVLNQQENNGIYHYKNYVGKLEYPYNKESVSYASQRFQYLYEKYLSGNVGEIYVSVIPDKGYYIPADSGYPKMDYDTLIEDLVGEMPWASYIDIRDTLDLSSYYYTDIHWSQEKLLKTAQSLLAGMGYNSNIAYHKQTVSNKFHGVYYGQSALSLPYEPIHILQTDTVDFCTVYNYETDKYTGIYDLSKLNGKDPYEVYLSGSVSLLKIENPMNQDGKDLILFRDSFGSSISPLLISSYRSITLVDIRYILPQLLDRYIEFDGQDVLFLYSVPVLNNSNTLK